MLLLPVAKEKGFLPSRVVLAVHGRFILRCWPTQSHVPLRRFVIFYFFVQERELRSEDPRGEGGLWKLTGTELGSAQQENGALEVASTAKPTTRTKAVQ
jgi:hypothetical protein